MSQSLRRSRARPAPTRLTAPPRTPARRDAASGTPVCRRGRAGAVTLVLAAGLAAGSALGAQPSPTPSPTPQPSATPAATQAPATMADLLAASGPEDWRPLDPERTLYLELASGRVVIELAPDFAPQHVANVKTLAREGYFDGLVILRSQDNYVVQWGDPNADDEAKRKPMRGGKRGLPAEMDRAASGAR